ncbi:MAG: cyclic nucleotide-binding domain-containing protein [Elusimicrobia bacterium]|nr:cyclic nucleotide-binding domain-containing protein [Elusimicrobiota bacterium]
MDLSKKLRLLKNLRLLAHVPESKRRTLAKFLEPVPFQDGDVIFEEGSRGDSLFFVSSGRVRIQKSVSTAGGAARFKDLAILTAGDTFGEMALFDEKASRSARAVAEEESVLLRLERKQLRRWLDANPSLALGFFNELVQTLARRLRRSSNELALLFDLSQWLLEPTVNSQELLRKTLGHLVPHLEGSWSAEAFLYNDFNGELEFIAGEGVSAPAAGATDPGISDEKNAWLDARTYRVCFPGPRHLKGYLVFRHAVALETGERDEIARTLTTAARLISSALENQEHRQEELLRARLMTTRQSYASGL